MKYEHVHHLKKIISSWLCNLKTYSHSQGAASFRQIGRILVGKQAHVTGPTKVSVN